MSQSQLSLPCAWLMDTRPEKVFDKDARRYALNCACLTRGAAVATDGRMMLKYTWAALADDTAGARLLLGVEELRRLRAMARENRTAAASHIILRWDVPENTSDENRARVVADVHVTTRYGDPDRVGILMLENQDLRYPDVSYYVGDAEAFQHVAEAQFDAKAMADWLEAIGWPAESKTRHADKRHPRPAWLSLPKTPVEMNKASHHNMAAIRAKRGTYEVHGVLMAVVDGGAVDDFQAEARDISARLAVAAGCGAEAAQTIVDSIGITAAKRAVAALNDKLAMSRAMAAMESHGCG